MGNLKALSGIKLQQWLLTIQMDFLWNYHYFTIGFFKNLNWLLSTQKSNLLLHPLLQILVSTLPPTHPIASNFLLDDVHFLDLFCFPKVQSMSVLHLLHDVHGVHSSENKKQFIITKQINHLSNFQNNFIFSKFLSVATDDISLFYIRAIKTDKKYLFEPKKTLILGNYLCIGT